MDGRRAVGTSVLVTGGTGTLGRLVVMRLLEAGANVRVLSRGKRARDERPGVEFVTGDLATGAGIDEALDGVEIVIHCAGTSKGDEVKARHLVQAAARAAVAGSAAASSAAAGSGSAVGSAAGSAPGSGSAQALAPGSRIRHLVFISVVGADRIPTPGRMDRAMFGYFASKLASERVIAESGLPWSTLRATQFHDLLLVAVSGMARLPVIPAPSGFRFQPIDADEVAARLVEVALGEPAGFIPEIGGPRAYEMADLVRSYLRAAGKHRAVVSMPVAGKAAAAIRAGANLTDRAVGRRTWEEFLAARVASGRDGVEGSGEEGAATVRSRS